METTLRTDITIGQMCEGFVYNELEGRGLYGLSGTLTSGWHSTTLPRTLHKSPNNAYDELHILERSDRGGLGDSSPRGH